MVDSERSTQRTKSFIDTLIGARFEDVFIGEINDALLNQNYDDIDISIQQETNDVSTNIKSSSKQFTSNTDLVIERTNLNALEDTFDDGIGGDRNVSPEQSTHLAALTSVNATASVESELSEASDDYDVQYGYGLVDASAAVDQAVGDESSSQITEQITEQTTTDESLEIINAPEVWDEGYTGLGVVVAVIDTGIDYTHTDLDANLWRNADEIAGNNIDDDQNGYVDDQLGWDFVDADNDPMDLEGHGTHVAGIIAAENDGSGTTGVAYNAEIMTVRVLDESGSGNTSDIANGIIYAADNGADVINLSLGGGFSSEIIDSIVYATEQGSVVVMAAGNESSAETGFPAGISASVGVAVGSVDTSGELSDFTNYAGIVEKDYVVAPGENIVSTTLNNSYAALSGTSMSTAYVSGVAALIVSANSNLSPSQVEDLIMQSADASTLA